MKKKFDIEFNDCGSIVVFNLLTAKARDWVAENVTTEPWQWNGNCTFSVEHGYATDLASKMLEKGFTLNGLELKETVSVWIARHSQN